MTIEVQHLEPKSLPREREEVKDRSAIRADRLYSFTDARLYIPSHQHGGPVAITTLHNWRREGKFVPVYRVRRDGRKCWFIRGSDILLLIGIEPKATTRPQTRGRASSHASLRDEGFKNT